jgi:hypothetical protein
MIVGLITRTEFAEHLRVDDDHEQRIRVIEKASEEALQRTGGIDKLVSKEDFAPIKKLVYSAVGLTLLLVGTEIIYLVLRK